MWGYAPGRGVCAPGHGLVGSLPLRPPVPPARPVFAPLICRPADGRWYPLRSVRSAHRSERCRAPPPFPLPNLPPFPHTPNNDYLTWQGAGGLRCAGLSPRSLRGRADITMGGSPPNPARKNVKG